MATASYQELLQQQADLARQVEEARKRESSDAVEQVRKMIADFGLTQADLFPSSGRRTAGPRAGGKVAPKYRDPQTDQTWTGRGKAPKWIDGQDRTKFLIA